MLQKDISFLLSGGLSNVDPNKSLGGPISTQAIDTEIDNLFSDVTREHTYTGYTDYRCFYIVNKNEKEKLKDCSIYVQKRLEGSEVVLGLSLQSDVQALMVSGTPHGGHFQLQYTIKHAGTTYIQTTREINWVPDANLMTQRIAAILNSLDFLSGVLCTGHQSSDGFDFLITFGGSSGGRGQELLAVVKSEGLQVRVVSVTKGGPINSVAPNIGFANNVPNNVTFFDSDRTTPIVLGTLLPNDFVPIWLKRVVGKNTPPIHPDSCSLHVFGDVLPVLSGKTNKTFQDR